MTESPSKATIYYNPNCSKCRLTLALLEEQGVEPTIVEYLNTPPNREELEHILGLLKLEPRDLMRKKEDLYKQLSLDNPDLDRDTLINTMIENPKLIERPIVITNNQAAIGRPPERILDIL